MPRKQVQVFLKIRDLETGSIVGENMANGYTDDDGKTVRVGAGYVPGLSEAPISDIRIEIIQPNQELPIFGLSVEADAESGDQIITVS